MLLGSETQMKLLRIGIANYRSLGETPVIVDLSRRVTVLIGANNSGKSNVLTAFVELGTTKGQFRQLGAADHHQRREDAWPRVVLEAEVEDGEILPGFRQGQQLRFVREFQGAPTHDKWIEHPLSPLDFSNLNQLMLKVTGQQFAHHITDPQVLERQYPEICNRLCQGLFAQIPEAHLIPQYRQIQAGSEYGVQGTGVVELLASWQHPEIGNDPDTHRFRRVEKLLQRLLHVPDAQLEVAHDKRTIIVQRGGLRLPLQSYGTGVHQVIILAIAVMSRDSVVFCIEEPEIHLHPTLQREFMRFLVEDTKNGYVIATHSPALIDPGGDVAIVHLELSSHTTTARVVQTPLDTLAVLRDLGIQPSDLLQANAAIWVEGPSDRIYVKRWLELAAPDLKEGIHFSIMFYGGRLLAHLALDRSEGASELISLLRIAQNSAVLIDSDRRSRKQPLNATKSRVRDEGVATGAYVWITEGREIENLLPPEAIETCYEGLTGSRPVLKIGRFGSLEPVLREAYGKSWRPKYSYETYKPERAREIARLIEAGMITQGVRERVEDLIRLIRSGPQVRQGDGGEQPERSAKRSG